MKILICIVLLAPMFTTQGICQRPDPPADSKAFAENRCLSKGGIGIIDKDFYVNLKSTKNELLLSAGNGWTGQNSSKQEVVIFFESKIWRSQVLPDGFDLSKAVVVSFECGKVRFFDFHKMAGCYYRRLEQN
jgi:hypothetical protein